MPRQVDHALRRREVAAIACELIASDGVEAATVRSVAEKARCSTTIVSHYFSNKHELLLFCYRAAAENSHARVCAVVKKDAADLQGCLGALLLLDKARKRDWAVCFALWAMAVGNTAFSREHRAWFSAAVELITAVARETWGIETPECDDWYRTEARRLFALVSGIAAQAVFDPSGFAPAKMREVVATEIARIDQSRRHMHKTSASLERRMKKTGAI